MQLGTILLIVTICTLIIVFALTPFTKKLSNNYWFWFTIGLFVFLYVFLGRQLKYIVPEFAPNTPEGLKWSRILLLDLCPFYGIFGPLSLMLKNKTVAKVLAPFGFFGAAITIFGQVIFEANTIPPESYWKYIFVGIGLNELYFMMHYLSLVLSFMIILWTRGWKPKLFVYANGFAIFYFAYVLIVVSIQPEIISNTTGILAADWLPGGEYHGVQEFLNIHTYPLVMIVGYLLAYLVIAFIFWFKYGYDVVLGRYGTKWKQAWTQSRIGLKLQHFLTKIQSKMSNKNS